MEWLVGLVSGIILAWFYKPAWAEKLVEKIKESFKDDGPPSSPPKDYHRPD
tara:strand:- start:14 stop:166 length:153 start_codon:yes stop_codon:yes gene_type:complete